MNEEFINNLADKLQKIGTLHAIGETWISIDSTIPAGGVPFLGQLVNRSVWADLFAWATAQGKVKSETEWQSYASANGGNCPFYSDGDGSTTFRMPKIVGYIKGAADLSEAGGYTAEGLPNITGEHCGIEAYSGASGCFYHLSTLSTGSGDSDNDNRKIGFDASRSSSIYGNSNHVTPETSVVLFGVYAVGVVANVGSVEATQFLSGLATLEATLEAGLASTVHIVETWSDGSNWYRKYSDGWIEQGGKVDITSKAGTTFSFNKAFSNVDTITIVALNGRCSNEDYTANLHWQEYTTTSTFHLKAKGYGGSGTVTGVNWYACGY